MIDIRTYFEPVLNTTPRVEYYPEFAPTKEGFGAIQAITYDGVDLAGKHTKVFAHIGFPENAEGPVPAVVLIHGGSGHTDDIWIKLWMNRGYAAIAMDTTGFFPQSPMEICQEGVKGSWERNLCEPFAEDGYVVSPHCSSMRDGDLPVTDQWMFHAVSQAILANNILRNDPRVDSAKIGTVGISWGGVIASILIGVDTRFAFAVPIYGAGYLGGLGACCENFRQPNVRHWLAEKYFDRVKTPAMWLGWNDDISFSVECNTLSYADTRHIKGTCLSMKHNMHHSHYSGYVPGESYWFADRITRGEEVPMPDAVYTYGSREISFSCAAPVKSVRLFYIDARMSYVKRMKHGIDHLHMEQDWQIIDLDPAARTVTAPEDAVGTYIEFTTEDGIVLTTPYHEF